MTDTWKDIQAFKSKQNSYREKIQKRKKEREEIVLSLTSDVPIVQSTSKPTGAQDSGEAAPSVGSSSTSTSPAVQESDPNLDRKVEKHMLLCLCDNALNIPIDSRALNSLVSKALGKPISQITVENLLQKFVAQDLIGIKDGLTTGGKPCVTVTSIEHTKILDVSNELRGITNKPSGQKRSSSQNSESEPKLKETKVNREEGGKDETIESLLSMPSTREKENKKMGEEILDLLSKPTAKEKSLAERFRSQGGAQVQEFCPYGTTDECVKVKGTTEPCKKLHFKKIIQKHTDESLGDCSFLNTCFHMDTCKYVHYEVDYQAGQFPTDRKIKETEIINKPGVDEKSLTTLFPQQWIQCDLRYFDMTILGKFSVVMADPPWDIHMELPYGTMSDDEMRHLNIPALQNDGFMFLWVTGRAMELGRECLRLWGYERCDEVIWVKTNQLQRIIRTGRTGHWLNHGKEHCLVGVKGNPAGINRGLDCDVVVAEVRATSHKPDEIYGMIERLSPGTRKIELFGRPHNVQPNWMTLGNQLDGVRLLDPELIASFKKRYPDGNCMTPYSAQPPPAQ